MAKPDLVTGALGFVGPHLIARLLADGREVVGVDLPRPDGPPPRRGPFVLVDPARGRYGGEPGAWECEFLSLDDADRLAAFIATVRPGAIFHLAAASSAAASFADPRAVVLGNLGSTLNLLEAVRALPATQRPTVVAVGSAEEYGDGARDGPCREDDALRPLSPYAVSKAAQTHLCLQYHRAWGLPVMVARAFNHTGPGQDERFAFPSFAAQIAAAEQGAAPAELRVGNLSAERDLLDVRDVVAAYARLRDAGRTGEIYNVCSGRSLTIQRGLEILLDAARIPVAIARDPARMRPADIPRLVGDPGKLHRDTGWRPAIDITATLRDVLDDARRRYR